jgi:hypothetical protein
MCSCQKKSGKSKKPMSDEIKAKLKEYKKKKTGAKKKPKALPDSYDPIKK